jgi:hypothetical protein
MICDRRHQSSILDGTHGQLVASHGEQGLEPQVELWLQNVGLLGHIEDQNA